MFAMTEEINGKTPSDNINLNKALSTRHTFIPFVLQGEKSSLQIEAFCPLSYLSFSAFHQWKGLSTNSGGICEV